MTVIMDENYPTYAQTVALWRGLRRNASLLPLLPEVKRFENLNKRPWSQTVVHSDWPSQNRSAYQHNRANVVAHISVVLVWCVWKSSIPITVSICLVPIAMKNLGFPNLHTAKYLHPNRVIQRRLYLACFSFKLTLP